jgi:predicted DNA-binding ribbon-helix-helix protein
MLINRNITVNGHRTSIRLEPEFWAGLADIARRENLTIDELCAEVDSRAGGLSRTAAIRVFITSYMVRLAQQNTEQLSHPFAAVAGGSIETQAVDEPKLGTQRFRAAS